jgi:acetylglutamate kinase
MMSIKDATRPVVVKIGGSTLGSHDTLIRDCASLQAEGRRLIVVHGGGATVSAWLERMQVPSEFVDGLRKTTAESRDVVVAVLGGLVNKTLVQQFEAAGIRAMGLSGADGGIVRSEMNQRGLGFVGEAPQCEAGPLRAFLDQGMMPVIAPIGLTPEGDALLNINADAVAGAVAVAIEASDIVFLTDVAGVQDGEGVLIDCLDGSRASTMRETGTLSGGMLPKVAACQVASAAGARARIVDGRVAGALPAALSGRGGTVVQ